MVSGHRRLTAIRTICKHDEPEKWKTVPCIVERGELSPAMRELRLIMANSDTRRMSGAEIAEQAERLTECLSALREEGVEFEGRTRDMVADILNVSKTRLATVKVIKEKLHERLKDMYDAGNIPESTAYRLAREDMRVQSQIYTKLSGKLPSMTEEQVAAAIEKEKQIDFETLDRAIAAKKDGAPEFSVAEYLAEREKENNRFYAAIAAMPERFLDELRKCKTRQDGIRALKEGIGLQHFCSAGGVVDFDSGPASITVDVLGKHPITRTWTEVWDTLAVLALRRWEPDAKLPAAAVSESDTKPTWRTGTPAKAGEYWCKFDCGGTLVRQKAYWNSMLMHWTFGAKNNTKVEAECIGWYQLPEE